jgi:hypothetical protein
MKKSTVNIVPSIKRMYVQSLNRQINGEQFFMSSPRKKFKITRQDGISKYVLIGYSSRTIKILFEQMDTHHLEKFKVSLFEAFQDRVKTVRKMKTKFSEHKIVITLNW